MTKCTHCDATVLTSTHGGEELMEMQTHYASWRRALQLARAMAAPSGVDHDDAAFWDHEIAAFDSAAPGGFAPRSRTFDTPAVGGERERIAKTIYEVEPHHECGEYVDGFQVSPGGNLPWEQAVTRDAEFGDDPLMGKITEFAFRAADALIAAQPASPLQDDCSCGGGDISGHDTMCPYASASPPEQPATPDTVKMFVDAIDAKNARIAQLEEALGKAVLQPAPVWNDPADVWEAYCAETPTKRRSPQGALAFGFQAALATAPDQEIT